MTTQKHFKLNISADDAQELLSAAYKAAVECRGGIYKPDKHTVGNISELAKIITAEGRSFGVMFCGACGNGKTTLLRALGDVIRAVQQNWFGGLSIYTAKEIAEKSKDVQEMKYLREKELLAIDDLGQEAAEVLDYGNILSPVKDILEYRYREQLFTVVTTNLTAKQIREKYGERIADRFNEMLKVIIFKNDSYRSPQKDKQ